MSKKVDSSQVKTILNKLVNECLHEKPEDPTPFLIQMLEDLKGNGTEPLTKEERVEMSRLRDELDELK